jgi:DNA repair photolyase
MVAYPLYLDAMDKDLAHIQITVTCLDGNIASKYEKNASHPSKRVQAIMDLQAAGFDVAIRLSPLLEEYMDFDKLNSLGINKCIVEFLRINHSIIEWFPMRSYRKYTHYHANYRHLPLEEKLRIISKVKLPSITVCEKVPEHYEYWRDHFNPNPADCCNLIIRSPQNILKTEGVKPKSKTGAANADITRKL